jgi:hypothetical protein
MRVDAAAEFSRESSAGTLSAGMKIAGVKGFRGQ